MTRTEAEQILADIAAFLAATVGCLGVMLSGAVIWLALALLPGLVGQ